MICWVEMGRGFSGYFLLYWVTILRRLYTYTYKGRMECRTRRAVGCSIQTQNVQFARRALIYLSRHCIDLGLIEESSRLR